MRSWRALATVLALLAGTTVPVFGPIARAGDSSLQRPSPQVVGTTRLANGKAVLTLNHAPFFPVIDGFPLPAHESAAVVDARLAALKAAGFTMLLTDVDYPWIFSRRDDLVQYLQAAQVEHFPIILELQEWDYWNTWLSAHPETNMRLFTGQYITGTYPDFANPAALREHLRRFQVMVKALSPFFHRPIVAFSIGAYDAYHIPDEEVHAGWSTPPHTTFPQTWLPYNNDVLPSYRRYLQGHGYTPAKLGIPTWQALKLPTQPDAKNPLIWASWMAYRMYGYVGAWLQTTASAVRRWGGLPVTVTLDIRPDGWADWGTPGLVEDRWFDFVLVYYYGLGSPARAAIESRLALLSHIYNDHRTPLISLLEFSSTPTAGDLYVTDSFPWVAGIAFFGATDPRRPEFLRAAHAAAAQRAWMQWPPAPPAGIVASLQDPYDLIGVSDAEEALEAAQMPFVVLDHWAGGRCPRLIIVPYGESLLVHSAAFRAAAQRFRGQGGRLLIAPDTNTIMRTAHQIDQHKTC